MGLRKGQTNKGTFKRGSVPNPKGRGASIPITKLFKESTAAVVGEIYRELMMFTEIQLKALVQAETTPILHKNIAQVLLRDMRNSEMDYSERVLNRIIGPIPARSELGGPGGTPLQMAPPTIVFEADTKKDTPNA